MKKFNKNTPKSKYLNYGFSKYAKQSDNVRYFRNNKKNLAYPTYRDAIPRPVKYSLNEMSVVNARYKYQQGLNMEASARNKYIVYKNTNDKYDYLRKNRTFRTLNGNKSYDSNLVNNFTYTDGNAARKINVNSKTKKQHANMHAVRGQKNNKGILQTSKLSPLLLGIAKACAFVVCFIAIVSFVRIGLTSASIINSINSVNISSKIDQELINKNSLEVQNSIIGNTSKVRESAEKLGMVTPSTIETIKLDQDIIAKDHNGNVSLVESLKRVADSTK